MFNRQYLLAATLLVSCAVRAESSCDIQVVQPADSQLLIDNVRLNSTTEYWLVSGTVRDTQRRTTLPGHIDFSSARSGEVIATADYVVKKISGKNPHNRAAIPMQGHYVFRAALPKQRVDCGGFRVLFDAGHTAASHRIVR